MGEIDGERGVTAIERNIGQLIASGFAVVFTREACGFVAYAASRCGRPAMRAGDTLADAASILARDLKDCKAHVGSDEWTQPMLPIFEAAATTEAANEPR